MRRYFKHSVLIGILASLFIPIIFRLKPMITLEPLSGVTETFERPYFSKASYWSGEYQEKMNAHINERFGLRTFFVRAINQIRYSLFNISKAPGVVQGKNKELYIESYLDEYLGRNYLGHDSILKITQQLKRVQDSLAAINVQFLVVFAPGKGSYRSENIPDKYLALKKDSTNYKTFSNLFKSQAVNFLDLNQSFRKNKDKFTYPVFPKNGAHWSHYGMCIGMDSILGRLEKLCKLDLPDFEYTNDVKLTNNLRGTDYDIGVLFNLLSDISKEVMPYPNYKVNDKVKEKPDVLVVGDSYWWCLVGEDLPSRFFKSDDYWFYNKDILLRNQQKKDKVKYVNLFKQVKNRKAIVLIATEATYYMFPYGFTNRLDKLLTGDSKAISDIMYKRIQPDTAWFEQIKKNATANGVSLEKQLYRDAKYIWMEDNGGWDATRAEIRKQITTNEKWYNEIKSKAEKEKRSVEEQISLDVEYMLKEENKAIYPDESTKEKESITSIINRIKSDEKWLNYTKEKAIKEGRTLEAQLEQEALFIQSQQ
jgi:hypothetical protein